MASDTCILFMCYPEPEGPTELSFGTGDEVRVDGLPICERILKTPGRRIAVEGVDGDGIFSMATKATETRVRVWANRDWLPVRAAAHERLSPYYPEPVPDVFGDAHERRGLRHRVGGIPGGEAG